MHKKEQPVKDNIEEKKIRKGINTVVNMVKISSKH